MEAVLNFIMFKKSLILFYYSPSGPEKLNLEHPEYEGANHINKLLRNFKFPI